MLYVHQSVHYSVKKNSGGSFFDGIHDTEYGISAEFRKHFVSTEFRYTEFRIPRNSVKIRNSVFMVTNRGHVIWLTEQRNSVKNTDFRNLILVKFRGKIPQNSGGIPYHGIPLDTLICTQMYSATLSIQGKEAKVSRFVFLIVYFLYSTFLSMHYFLFGSIVAIVQRRYCIFFNNLHILRGQLKNLVRSLIQFCTMQQNFGAQWSR